MYFVAVGMQLCGTVIPDSFCTALGRQSEVDKSAGWAVESGTAQEPHGE